MEFVYFGLVYIDERLSKESLYVDEWCGVNQVGISPRHKHLKDHMVLSTNHHREIVID